MFLRTVVDIDPNVPDEITPLDWTDENRVGCELYFQNFVLGLIQILGDEVFLKDTKRRE